MDFGSLIPVLAENLAALLPARAEVIFSYEEGVRFTLGKQGSSLGPGLHWYLGWGMGDIQTIENTIKCLELEPQSCVTEDGAQVTVNTQALYSVSDYGKLLRTVNEDDYEEALTSLIAGNVTQAVRLLSFDDLLDDLAHLWNELEKELAPAMEEWGLTLHDVVVTDAVRAKHVRLIGGM